LGAILNIAAGGALGAVLRYLSTQGAARLFGAGFPWGTLFVNVLGGFLMGLAVVWFVEKGGRVSPLLMTGLLGGFTTFSAFSLDAIRLFENGRPLVAGGYILGSVALSLGACGVGIWLGRSTL